MAGERTIAPTPGRLNRAWRAGVRPTASWLLPGSMCIALAAAMEQAEPDLAGVVDPLRAALASPGRPDLAVLPALAQDALAWAVGLLLAVLAMGLAVRIVTGDAGPIDAAARRRLRIGSSRVSASIWLLLCTAMAGLSFSLLLGVLAGAARAADADARALVQLWSLWSARTLWTVGALLVAGGLAELLLGRRQRWRALHLSFEEAREERREAGQR